jgi:hypothetical protein
MGSVHPPEPLIQFRDIGIRKIQLGSGKSKVGQTTSEQTAVAVVAALSQVVIYLVGKDTAESTAEEQGRDIPQVLRDCAAIEAPDRLKYVIHAEHDRQRSRSHPPVSRLSGANAGHIHVNDARSRTDFQCALEREHVYVGVRRSENAVHLPAHCDEGRFRHSFLKGEYYYEPRLSRCGGCGHVQKDRSVNRVSHLVDSTAPVMARFSQLIAFFRPYLLACVGGLPRNYAGRS